MSTARNQTEKPDKKADVAELLTNLMVGGNLWRQSEHI